MESEKARDSIGKRVGKKEKGEREEGRLRSGVKGGIVSKKGWK